MRTLVTGGAGYVGGTVAAQLASQGYDCTVFDNLSHARREMVPAGVEFIEGDLSDCALLEEVFRSAKGEGRPFDAVLHFAALIEAGESMVRPEMYFRNNTASTLALLEAMIAAGPRRLVFSSTAAVYGEPESVPITEDARLKPTNVYGESKLIVEMMLGWFHRIHGLRSVSLRYDRAFPGRYRRRRAPARWSPKALGPANPLSGRRRGAHFESEPRLRQRSSRRKTATPTSVSRNSRPESRLTDSRPWLACRIPGV